MSIQRSEMVYKFLLSALLFYQVVGVAYAEGRLDGLKLVQENKLVLPVDQETKNFFSTDAQGTSGDHPSIGNVMSECSRLNYICLAGSVSLELGDPSGSKITYLLLSEQSGVLLISSPAKDIEFDVTNAGTVEIKYEDYSSVPAPIKEDMRRVQKYTISGMRVIAVIYVETEASKEYSGIASGGNDIDSGTLDVLSKSSVVVNYDQGYLK